MKLTPEDFAAVTKTTTAEGGINDLIRDTYHKFLHRDEQEVWFVRAELPRVLPKIVNYWRRTGMGRKPGAGGYQRRLAMASLRQCEELKPYLPSCAPLFVTDEDRQRLNPPRPVWVYFSQGVVTKQIKIGCTVDPHSRRARGWRTDSAEEVKPLLWLLAAAELGAKPDHFYHRQFQTLRIHKKREWFRPGEELMRFIGEKSAEQKLSQ